MPVSTGLEEAVREARKMGLRAVQAIVDSKRPRLIAENLVLARSTWSHDFNEIVSYLEEATPCLFLIRLQVADGHADTDDFSDKDWLLLHWTPKATSEAARVKYVAAHEILLERFEEFHWRELVAEDRRAVSLGAAMARVKPMTQEDRDAAASREEGLELRRRRRHQEAAQEGSVAPRIDYGLRGPAIMERDSFAVELGRLRAEAEAAAENGAPTPPTAVLVHMAVVEGAHGTRDGRAVSAEALPGMVGLQEERLGDFLPGDKACYAVVWLRESRSLALVLWLPQGASEPHLTVCVASHAAVVALVEKVTDLPVELVIPLKHCVDVF